MTRRHSSGPYRLPLALAAALLMLGGCHKPSSDPLAVAVIGSAPLTLGDPLAVPSSEAQAVLRLNLAQGLVRFDSRGQVEPALAERWNVSDDGLSYIFRLAAGEWPDGRKIMARDVARMIKRQLRAGTANPTRDALGSITDVVAMTDRVIEIRLAAPRPNLLELLAQPEWALIREGVGSGPFQRRIPDPRDEARGAPADLAPLWLTRRIPGVDGDPGAREDVSLAPLAAAPAIARFMRGSLDLVLGGTIADLPLATRAKLPGGALHFDPAGGLFGLQPGRANGPLADPELRRLLSKAIDRAALVAALGVPGLGPRATVLQAGLDGVADPVQPAWLGQPPGERRIDLEREAQRLFGNIARPRLTIALPPGPGGDLLLARLTADWGAIGIKLDRAVPGARPDLKFVDMVAPSTSPSWFLRQLRCGVAPLCNAEVDTLLDAARTAPDPLERGADLAEAARLIDDGVLFVSLAAPVRWSLVGERALGYEDNRYARHPLADIVQRAPRGY
jgi:oligopeptide transport system substrate-binding protein